MLFKVELLQSLYNEAPLQLLQTTVPMKVFVIELYKAPMKVFVIEHYKALMKVFVIEL